MAGVGLRNDCLQDIWSTYFITLPLSSCLLNTCCIHGIVISIQVFVKTHNTFAYKERTHSLFVSYFCKYFLRFVIIFVVVLLCIIIYICWIWALQDICWDIWIENTMSSSQLKVSISLSVNQDTYSAYSLMRKINLVCTEGLCESTYKLKLPLTFGYQRI